MNRWYWGADGLYTFNLFPHTPDARFSELGSPETLRGLDKIYGMDNPTAESVLGTFKLSVAAPDALPISLEAGQTSTASLAVGEDISANAPAGKTATALLRFQIPALSQNQQVILRFNGQDCGTPVKRGTHYEISIDPRVFMAGYNSIDFKLSDGPKASLEALDLVVSYR